MRRPETRPWPSAPSRTTRRPVKLASDVFGSPVGDLHIVCASGVVCAVDFGDFGARLHRLLARRFEAYEVVREHDPLGVTSALRAYFDGNLQALDALPVDGGGSPYQTRVWHALRTIPPGRTRSYGELAAQLGQTHARAVGQANSLNPIAIIVPCHRVIGANATLTGYAGGLERKRWLLDHEARYAGHAPLLPVFA